MHYICLTQDYRPRHEDKSQSQVHPVGHIGGTELEVVNGPAGYGVTDRVEQWLNGYGKAARLGIHAMSLHAHLQGKKDKYILKVLNVFDLLTMKRVSAVMEYDRIMAFKMQTATNMGVIRFRFRFGCSLTFAKPTDIRANGAKNTFSSLMSAGLVVVASS